MPTTREDQNFAQQSATVFHPISTADETAMGARRTIVEPHKGGLRGIAARAPFDAIMEHVAVPEGAVFEAGVVGGVPGWWSKPEGVQPLGRRRCNKSAHSSRDALPKLPQSGKPEPQN